MSVALGAFPTATAHVLHAPRDAQVFAAALADWLPEGLQVGESIEVRAARRFVIQAVEDWGWKAKGEVVSGPEIPRPSV